MKYFVSEPGDPGQTSPVLSWAADDDEDDNDGDDDMCFPRDSNLSGYTGTLNYYRQALALGLCMWTSGNFPYGITFLSSLVALP